MADDKQPVVKKGNPSKRWEKYEAGEPLKRKNPFCPKCGPGIFLANHKDRKTCGSCGYMEKTNTEPSDKKE
ncbi:30S ribosomal protein S27ae [Candidatus Woesearchaeota archaeon]|jgi:ubiquitin-small subunit ribosomal protein S27Ae|nr:30S ribosomal protein S27ae [Candidatus Woesearchaeota archaeon]MBT4368157.1 30S ribosomal protein S27ae [Candidatus Woesearchaeota archaeon]MBT4712645.1 30S ribosomal protein S27ae [Candidatus Woesearchaeota archaeon]MBT6639558.1 30S ribosomal protein S27ae [Candidatus Woesearchaeota archaeon]MBT7133730.1 30S ribosomal protein S27ae [Candidatus Woesearchaeota archaeon]